MRIIHGPDQDSGNSTRERNLIRFPAPAGGHSPAVVALLQLCIDLRYGRVEQLHVRGGEPVFDPAPEVIKTVKLSETDAVDTPPSLSQILSKPQTQALLRVLAGVKSGCVLRLEVRDSQPCYAEIGLSATEEATRA